MRYRSITLNDNKEYQFSLIKYNKDEHCLEKLEGINSELAEAVEKYPTMYGGLSDHQSYMVYTGEKTCVGAICIDSTDDEKKLKVKIQLKEEMFENKESIFALVEQIVNSLKMYRYDKENIEIQLLNDIDMEIYNQLEYKKITCDSTSTTYITSNKFNNSLFSKLLKEMGESEQTLTNWKQCWMQSYSLCGLNDWHHIFDEELIGEYKDGSLPLSEIFYKAESVSWDGIKSINSRRSIDFARNGEIQFTKTQKNMGKNSYKFLYYILSNEFNLKKIDPERKDSLEIDENRDWTKINSDNLKVVYLKEDRIKKVQYKSPIVDRSSIYLELYINEQGEIERCCVDFITYKRKHKEKLKINGTYALRLFPKKEKCRFSLKFISRKGSKNDIFADELEVQDEQLFTTILNGILNENLTFELIDELINKILPIINEKELSKGKSTIAAENESIALDAREMENEAINYVKQIKGEIPLPHLQENLEKFIKEYDTKKNNPRRVLK